MTINENIRKLRAERGLTLEALGKAVGVSKQTIQRYENGQISTIPYDKILSLASALNVTPGHLMGWEEPDENPLLIKLAEDVAFRNRIIAYAEKIMGLSPEHQATITSMIDFLTAEEEKNK